MGGNVFFAADAEGANRYILDLAAARDVKTAVKSKSMVSEEMEERGIHVVCMGMERIVLNGVDCPFSVRYRGQDNAIAKSGMGSQSRA